MVVLDGNFAVGCGPGTDYSRVHIFQCMLERTDAITNEVLEPIKFVLAYPTVYQYVSADSLQGTGRQLVDLSPSDCHLCGHLKALVCSVPTENEETPYQRNFYACQTIRNRSGT